MELFAWAADHTIDVTRLLTPTGESMTKMGSARTMALLAAATQHDPETLISAARKTMPNNRLNAAVIKVAAAAVAMSTDLKDAAALLPPGTLSDIGYNPPPEPANEDNSTLARITKEIENITAILESSSTTATVIATLTPELTRLEAERDGLRAKDPAHPQNPASELFELRGAVSELRNTLNSIQDSLRQAITGDKRKALPTPTIVELDGPSEDRRKRERIADRMIDPNTNKASADRVMAFNGLPSKFADMVARLEFVDFAAVVRSQSLDGGQGFVFHVNDDGTPMFATAKTNKQVFLPQANFVSVFRQFINAMADYHPALIADMRIYEAHIYSLMESGGVGYQQYDYSFRQYAAEAAKANIPFDWTANSATIAQRYNTGLSMNCKQCGSNEHPSSQCKAHVVQPSTYSNAVPLRDGAPGRRSGGKSCHAFNSAKGCHRPKCSYPHVCQHCLKKGHTVAVCRSKETQPPAL